MSTDNAFLVLGLGTVFAIASGWTWSESRALSITCYVCAVACCCIALGLFS